MPRGVFQDRMNVSRYGDGAPTCGKRYVTPVATVYILNRALRRRPIMGWCQIDESSPPIGRPLLVRTIEGDAPAVAFLSPEKIWYAGAALGQSSMSCLARPHRSGASLMQCRAMIIDAMMLSTRAGQLIDIRHVQPEGPVIRPLNDPVSEPRLAPS